jgi:hypothetical protein
MRRPQPQWIIKKHLPELSTMYQLMTGQNDTVLLQRAVLTGANRGDQVESGK